MNTPDYESIWQQSLIRVTDKFSLPPIVLRVDDAIIGTLGNFSVSTGKAKAKKTFNVSALVASALSGGLEQEYRACFPENVLSKSKCKNLRLLSCRFKIFLITCHCVSFKSVQSIII